jgi:hypothetical protein
MNSKLSIPSAILALGLVVLGYQVSHVLVKGKQLDREVSVKGLAEREMPADLAVWPMQISYGGNDLSALQKTLDRAATELQTFFKEQGFNADEISRGTTNILDANADPYRDPQQGRINRYKATADFTLRTSDIAKLERTVAAAPSLIKKDIIISNKNTWMPIEYLFTKLNTVKPEMVEEANKNARIVAEKFAQDSGSKVGKIKTARQGMFSINNRDQYTPQIKVIRVVNTVDYYLLD